MASVTDQNSDVWPIDGLVAWADRAHRLHTGLPLGKYTVVRATPWSTVIRWAVGDTHVWGKAVCPGFAAECALVPLLAQRVPHRVVAPIATKPKAGWMLFPDGGPTLAASTDVATWKHVMVGYAGIQRAFAGADDVLSAVGLPDMRPHAAVDRLEEMMRHGDVPKHPSLVRSARAVANQIDLGIVPATVQHDDLRPDNVFADGRVFDWGDASLAHPFASLLTALLPNRPGTRADKADVRDAYLGMWQRAETEGDKTPTLAALRDQAELAVRLAPIGRIDTWLRAPASALRAYPDAVDRWVNHLLATSWL